MVVAMRLAVIALALAVTTAHAEPHLVVTGLDGHATPTVAAALATEAFTQALVDQKPSTAALSAAFEAANAAIQARAKADVTHKGMGATAAALWIDGTKAHIAHVGVGSSRVDLQACKLEYSIVSPK